MQGQTIRVHVANLSSLKTKREAIATLMKVIQETIDWAYSDPMAIDMYAGIAKVSRAVTKRSIDEFYPKDALQLTKILRLQKTLDEALQYKRVSEKKTVKDAAGMIDPVLKPAK
jgi:NitT/TauT family transport system substrate-binding protein